MHYSTLGKQKSTEKTVHLSHFFCGLKLIYIFPGIVISTVKVSLIVSILNNPLYFSTV